MKILITGFFGERNLGDETILRAILANFDESFRLVLTCGRFPSVSRPELIPRCGLRAWPEYLRAVSESDRVVFSGGILQDWSFEGVTFFALRILAASIFKAEPSLWGAGIGPLRRLTARRIARKALGRVKVAWLRDQLSLELFDNMAKSRGNLGTDWSWQFDVKPTSQAFTNGPLGVNLRPWPFSSWQADVEAQQKHVDRHVIGIPARPSDAGVIKQLFHRATLLNVSDFAEAAGACQNLSYGIAMRYHMALAMLRAGLPVKLVAYDDKVLNLAREAGVNLLNEDRVAGFKQAGKDFFRNNEARFSSMKHAFVEYFKA